MQVTQRFAQLLTKNVGKVIVGKDKAVELMMIAVLCRGHVLIEDVPGVGKTTLASALAKSLDCSFKRIQFTPDITPSDITGFSIANFKTGELEYRPGMIMSQIVLADEINRTSPKTQSSLLEVMEEGQVSVDGTTYAVPQPFIVLATQNPVDFVGTYPLPEAQLDRFFMRISIGYPTAEEETDILERYTTGQRPMEELRPICTSGDIALLQQEVEKVYSSKEVRAYISTIAAASRKTNALQLGVSTRAAISLLKASQARALLDGRDYVTPEDVQKMAEPVLAHRLVLSPEARMRNMTAERILANVMGAVQVPVKVKVNGRMTGVLAAMLTLLAAGLSTGTRIYYLLFDLLLMMILLGLISALWTIWTVKIDMKGVRPRVNRGENLMTVFTVRHQSLLPVASVRITINVPSSYAPTQEISVHTPPFAERFFRHVIQCPHRGVYEAGVTKISAKDMFGLFTLSRRPKARLLRVEVLPKVPDAAEMELKTVDMGPECMARSSEDAASPSDVRAWQDGDSLKKVHWKLSMRRREVMVRTYEESARPDTLIIPDLSEVTALKDQQLTVEDCILESCLGAAKAQLDAGYPVRMPLTSARPLEISGQFPADLPGFVDALLRVQFDSPFAYEKVLIQMLARMQRTGGAVLATSKLTLRVADLAMRIKRSGVQVKFVWVSDDPREESLEILERLRMEGVQVEQIDPWKPETRRAALDLDDECNF